MKKKRIIILLGILLFTQFLTSCAMLNDPAFYEGFREGWNSTAPEQYRY